MTRFVFAIPVCLLFSLFGCGGGSGANNNVNQSQVSVLVNHQNINTLQYLTTIGTQDVEIKNTGNTAIAVTDQKLINNENALKNKCNMVLQPQQSCVVTIDIEGIHTKKTFLDLKVFFDSKNQVFSIPVWNYNYQTPSISMTTESQIKHLGKQTTFIINNSSAPVYINQLTFDSATIDDKGNTVYFDKIVESENSCGGTLLGHARCFIPIDFTGVYPTDKEESLTIGYIDGTTTINLHNHNTIDSLYKEIRLHTGGCFDFGTCYIMMNGYFPHKLILKKVDFIDKPDNINILTNVESGCNQGVDFSKAGNCSVEIQAKSLPIDSANIGLRFYFSYYIDESHIIDLNSTLLEAIKISAVEGAYFSLNQHGNPFPSRCDMHPSEKDSEYSFTPAFIDLIYHSDIYSAHIQSIKFTPSETNFETWNPETGLGVLIKPAQAVLENGCFESALFRNNDRCQLYMQSGCQGSGSEGTLAVTYTFNHSLPITQVFTLNEVEQPHMKVLFMQGEESMNVWSTGQKIEQPVHINVRTQSIHMVQLIALFNNWMNTSTFFYVKDKYVISNDFLPTGNSNSIGVAWDFSRSYIGESFPVTLKVGNRMQDQIDVVFDVVSSLYKKPKFLGGTQ